MFFQGFLMFSRVFLRLFEVFKGFSFFLCVFGGIYGDSFGG